MSWVYRRPASVPHRHLLRRPAQLVAGAASAPVLPGDALITTQTVVNESASIATNQALQWGVPLKRGAIDLSTHELFVTDESDNEVPAQFDEVATWDNDTVFHAACSLFVNSVAGSATRQYKFKKRNGSMPTASALRTLADITAQDFRIILREVRGASDVVYNGGEFEFVVNTYAAIAARVKKTATGPIRDSWRIDGEFVRTGTSTKDDHLWGIVHIDVWTSPSNPDIIHGFSIDAVVCTPWRNVTTAQAQTLSFFADLKNGATTLFSFDTPNYQTINAATEITTTSGNTVTKSGGHGLQQGAASGRMTTTGTMPSGMTAGQTVWLARAGAAPGSTTQYRLQGQSGTLTLTSVGTGTHTIRRCAWMPYRSAIVLRNVSGPVWTANEPTVLPQLDTTEQEYWIQSGHMPPLDLAANPGSTAASNYWPGNANGLHNLSINAGGTSAHIGPQPNWVVRAFINQNAAGLKMARAGALDLLNIFNISLLEDETSGGEKLGSPIVGNNGPDNVGGTYPGMGSPRPNTRWYSSSNRSSDWSVPTGKAPIFDEYERSGPDGSHWGNTYQYPYLVDGRRLWLEAMWGDCNRHTFARGLTNPGSRTVNGTTYYGLQMDHEQAARANPWKFRNLAFTAKYGSDDNPEKTYFRDKFVANLGYMRNDYPLRGGGFLELGQNSLVTAIGGQTGKSFSNGFQGMVHAWVYALDRGADAAWLAEHSAKWARNVWLGRLSGQVYYDINTQWYLVRPYPAGRTGDEITYLSEQGVCMGCVVAADGQTCTIRNAVGQSVSRVFLTTGDTLRFINTNNGLSPAALPPEELTGTVTFHTTNVDTVARTCNLALSPGGAAQTFTPGSYYCVMKMQTGSAIGSFEGGNTDYPQNFRAAAIWCKFVGIPDMDASVVEADARYVVNVAQWMFDSGYSLQDQTVTVESGGGGAAIVPISAAYYARLRAA